MGEENAWHTCGTCKDTEYMIRWFSWCIIKVWNEVKIGNTYVLLSYVAATQFVPVTTCDRTARLWKRALLSAWGSAETLTTRPMYTYISGGSRVRPCAEDPLWGSAKSCTLPSRKFQQRCQAARTEPEPSTYMPDKLQILIMLTRGPPGHPRLSTIGRCHMYDGKMCCHLRCFTSSPVGQFSRVFGHCRTVFVGVEKKHIIDYGPFRLPFKRIAIT